MGTSNKLLTNTWKYFLSVEAITSDTNLKALRHLYDTNEAQVHGLKSMDVTSEEYESLLSSVVLSKIPQDICLIICCEIGDGDRKLDNLMKILLSELQAQERELQPAT